MRGAAFAPPDTRFPSAFAAPAFDRRLRALFSARTNTGPCQACAAHHLRVLPALVGIGVWGGLASHRGPGRNWHSVARILFPAIRTGTVFPVMRTGSRTSHSLATGGKDRVRRQLGGDRGRRPAVLHHARSAVSGR